MNIFWAISPSKPGISEAKKQNIPKAMMEWLKVSTIKGTTQKPLKFASKGTPYQ